MSKAISKAVDEKTANVQTADIKMADDETAGKNGGQQSRAAEIRDVEYGYRRSFLSVGVGALRGC